MTLQRTLKILYVAVFLLALCLPAPMMPFFRNDPGLEKKAMEEFPAYVSDGRLNQQFSDQFESWFSDSFPMRASFLTASNLLKGELLHEETSNVIDGKDGWLFFSSEAADYMDTEPMTEDELCAFAVTLSLLQERTEQNGGHFVFAGVPNKSSVYPEKMPERYRQGKESNLQRIQPVLSRYGVNFTDLLGLMAEHREEGLYHRRDSHWNYRGALLGADAILKSIGRPHEDCLKADFTVRKDWRGDLDKLLLPAGGVMDEQVYYDVRHAKFSFRQPQGIVDTEKQLQVFMSDREERDMLFVTQNKEKKDGSTLLMARDSFGRALLPWMIDSYENAVFRRTDLPDLVSLTEGSDVILEIAERNLRRIIARAPFLYAPIRPGITAEGMPRGRKAESKLDTEGYLHVYGTLPEGTHLGSGHVFLLLENEETSLCLEAFPIYEAALLGDAPRNGFSAYLSEDLGLSGRYELSVLVNGTAYPGDPLLFE